MQSTNEIRYKRGNKISHLTITA